MCSSLRAEDAEAVWWRGRRGGVGGEGADARLGECGMGSHSDCFFFRTQDFFLKIFFLEKNLEKKILSAHMLSRFVV